MKPSVFVACHLLLVIVACDQLLVACHLCIITLQIRCLVLLFFSFLVVCAYVGSINVIDFRRLM